MCALLCAPNSAEKKSFLNLRVVGDNGVGASNIGLRFTKDEYSESYISSVEVALRERTVQIDGEDVKLRVFDDKPGPTLKIRAYRNFHGFLLAFDISDRESFDNLEAKWLRELDMYAPDTAPVFLVGAQADRVDQRAVPQEDAQRFAEKHGYQYFEVSAKTGDNIEAVFMALARAALKPPSKAKEDKSDSSCNIL